MTGNVTIPRMFLERPQAEDNASGSNEGRGKLNATIEAVTALIASVVNCSSARRRGGRVAECGGLLNRCTG